MHCQGGYWLSEVVAGGADALEHHALPFGLNEGAFLGVSIEGSLILTNENRTTSYYNSPTATPKAVVLRGEYANAEADTLRSLLAKLSQPAS